MTYTDRQVVNLAAALIKAEAYISSGRTHAAHEIIIVALDKHRCGLPDMDQVTAFDNLTATIGAAVNFGMATPVVNSKPSDPETAA